MVIISLVSCSNFCLFCFVFIFVRNTCFFVCCCCCLYCFFVLFLVCIYTAWFIGVSNYCEICEIYSLTCKHFLSLYLYMSVLETDHISLESWYYF